MYGLLQDNPFPLFTLLLMLFTERRTRSSVLFLVWSQLLFTPLAAVIKPLELVRPQNCGFTVNNQISATGIYLGL